MTVAHVIERPVIMCIKRCYFLPSPISLTDQPAVLFSRRGRAGNTGRRNGHMTRMFAVLVALSHVHSLQGILIACHQLPRGPPLHLQSPFTPTKLVSMRVLLGTPAVIPRIACP